MSGFRTCAVISIVYYEGLAPQRGHSDGLSKPPYAALLKRHRGERYGKGVDKASGVDQGDERK